MAETKKCEVCDQEIGTSEKTCPKCGTNFEELEEEVKVVTRAQNVAQKRAKAAVPPEPEKPAKKSIFRSLAPKGK
jgi:RNA polymerase subunit RPABC4/transcription elongation factor Spt4